MAPGTNGALVCLANDASYWRAPGHDRETNAGAFRLHEGLELSGERAWGPMTGAGTRRGREHPLTIRGRYRLAWSDYALLPGRNGVLRVLVVPVVAPLAPPVPANPALVELIAHEVAGSDGDGRVGE